MTTDYNTGRPALLMPEYGRLVQEMVDEALKIENRAGRQTFAAAIVDVMAALTPQMKNVPDYRSKLWDHLAFISGYRLDVDYPCEIHRPDTSTPPAIPYPGHQVNYRHYGTLVEQALKEVAALPNGAQRTEALRGIGTRMKRSLSEFRDEQPGDRRVEHDIERVSDETVRADFSARPLAYIKVEKKEPTKKRKKK